MSREGGYEHQGTTGRPECLFTHGETDTPSQLSLSFFLSLTLPLSSPLLLLPHIPSLWTTTSRPGVLSSRSRSRARDGRHGRTAWTFTSDLAITVTSDVAMPSLTSGELLHDSSAGLFLPCQVARGGVPVRVMYRSAPRLYAPFRSAPHRIAPHCTAMHRTAPHRSSTPRAPLRLIDCRIIPLMVARARTSDPWYTYSRELASARSVAGRRGSPRHFFLTRSCPTAYSARRTPSWLILTAPPSLSLPSAPSRA